MTTWGRLDGGRMPAQGRDEGYPTRNLSNSTDVATLQDTIETLQAEFKTTNTAIALLAASVAHLEAVQAPPANSTATTPATTPATTTAAATTPAATTTNTPGTTIPLCSCPHASNPCTIASGRGAASPEVFQEMIKKNWHGRLGRTHMVEVDGLSTTALAELDCFVRRRLHAIFPRGVPKVTSEVDADRIFATLAVLGLRLEDRGAYADLPTSPDAKLGDAPTATRVRNTVAWYASHEKYADYWHASALETLMELGRYRGLFDKEGYLKVE